MLDTSYRAGAARDVGHALRRLGEGRRRRVQPAEQSGQRGTVDRAGLDGAQRRVTGHQLPLGGLDDVAMQPPLAESRPPAPADFASVPRRGCSSRPGARAAPRGPPISRSSRSSGNRVRSASTASRASASLPSSSARTVRERSSCRAEPRLQSLRGGGGRRIEQGEQRPVLRRGRAASASR